MLLVTGGCGFIGSNLCHELIKNHKVRVLDNLSTGYMKNISSLLDNSNFEFMHGDIADFEICMKACENVDYIFHQAARPSVIRSFADPASTFRVNVEGTTNIFQAALKQQCKRIIFASSSSVYGDAQQLPKHEEQSLYPKSPYALSKLANEQISKIYFDTYGLESIGLRYFNVVGRRQDPTSEYAAVVPNFIKANLSGESPHIFGDGEQTRDFCPINNVVQANICSMNAKLNDKTPRIFNIACGKQYTVNYLSNKINEIMSMSNKPVYLSPRKGDIRHSLADIGYAQKHLGYNINDTLEQALCQTIDWMKNE